MKKLSVFLLLMLSLNLFSQTNIDSLETQLKIVNGKEKVDILNELAKAYWRISPEKSLGYGHQALGLAEKLNFNEGEANSLRSIAIGNYYINNYEEALQYYHKALTLYKKIGNITDISKALNNIGVFYQQLSKYEKAIECYKESLKLYEEIGNKTGMASAYNNMGVVYRRLSNYEKALECYFNALKISEEISDNEVIASCLNNIGLVYNNLEKYDKALEYYKKSIKIEEKIANDEGIATSFLNIGTIYWHLKKYDKALEYYQKSLIIHEKVKNKYSMATSLNNIGLVYLELLKYNKALEYIQKALIIRKKIEDKKGIASTSRNIGIVYTRILEFNKAYPYLKKGLELSIEIEAKDLVKDCYDAFSELYTAKEDYRKALEYYKLYTEVKDSIFTEESSEKIAEMQTKYETEKKEKENEILKKDNDIQKLEINKQQNLRNSFIVISVLVLILAFVIYTRYRSKQKTNIILNQKNIEIENANTELNKKNKQITKQKNQLSKTLKELRETQKMLTDTAHRAGMAEIATGILHNVGNVLNSVKVSSQVLMEKIKSSKVNNLQKVLSLMEEHTDNIGEFITSDEKGKMLPEYLIKVGATLKEEQDNSLKELSNLHKGINHIEEIIAVQQNYAGVSGLIEKVAISDMMDDVLKMHSEMFRKYKINVTKNYSKTIPVMVEKGKLIQVFVNLLKNAKESLEAKDETNRIIIINIFENKEKQIIEIVDNGIGIVEKNLAKIFSYGFSTKKAGKGFGLHTSALAMIEMKGKLTAESEGEGKGAKFIVNIPLKKNRSNHEEN